MNINPYKIAFFNSVHISSGIHPALNRRALNCLCKYCNQKEKKCVQKMCMTQTVNKCKNKNKNCHMIALKQFVEYNRVILTNVCEIQVTTITNPFTFAAGQNYFDLFRPVNRNEIRSTFCSSFNLENRKFALSNQQTIVDGDV